MSKSGAVELVCDMLLGPAPSVCRKGVCTRRDDIKIAGGSFGVCVRGATILQCTQNSTDLNNVLYPQEFLVR